MLKKNVFMDIDLHPTVNVNLLLNGKCLKIVIFIVDFSNVFVCVRVFIYVIVSHFILVQ